MSVWPMSYISNKMYKVSLLCTILQNKLFLGKAPQLNLLNFWHKFGPQRMCCVKANNGPEVNCECIQGGLGVVEPVGSEPKLRMN